MTMKITRWNPDTCGCVLEYEWDDAVPQDQRTHNLYNVVRRCADHQGLGANTEVYTGVLEENQRKNIARKTLLDNAPSQLYDIIDANGNREFKNGIELTWTWTGTAPNRILNMVVTGYSLTTNQKNAIQTKLNDRFGISNVIVTSD